MTLDIGTRLIIDQSVDLCISRDDALASRVIAYRSPYGRYPINPYLVLCSSRDEFRVLTTNRIAMFKHLKHKTISNIETYIGAHVIWTTEKLLIECINKYK